MKWILLIALWIPAHSRADEPPATAQEWILQQAKAAQTIPEVPQCYQARTRPNRWDVVCISEMQWQRIHAEDAQVSQ